MKKYRIPIFTEEYVVNVFIGKRDELIKFGSKFTTYSPKTIRTDFEGNRGITYNLYPELNPLILIDGEFPAISALATLAHESSHAIDYIMDNLGMDDRSGEFRGHGIATIIRKIGKDTDKEPQKIKFKKINKF